MEGRSLANKERGHTGRSPLHTAAYNGHLLKVTDLLQRGSQLEAPSRLPSDNGSHALHLATLNRHSAVVDELLNRGADPDAADQRGFRPLHIAAQIGAEDIVERLHKANANLSTRTKAGLQGVHLAACNGHIGVLKLLQDYHCNLAEPDSNLARPLHYAADMGHQEAVRWLIKAGVSLTVKDGENNSAADRAKLKNHHAIYKDLTEAEKRSVIKHKKGMKQRSTSELLFPYLERSFKLQRPKLLTSSSPHLSSSSAPSTSSYQGQRTFDPGSCIYAHTPHPKTISTVLPDTAAKLCATLSPQNTPTQSLQSPQSLHVQSSHEVQISSPKSPPPQRLHLKASPIQRTSFQGVQTPQSPPTLPLHDGQTLKPSIQRMKSTENNVGSIEFHGISLNSSPVILDSSSSPSIERPSPSVSSVIYSTDTVTSRSSTSSLSSSDLSQSPTAFISTPLPFPKEGNSVKNRENKVTDGCSLGHGEQNHPGESHHQQAAVLDLYVQEAVRPFKEGPDVYPCTSNPRGIVIILNNKSFHDHPELTRYGSECDTKNLEDVFRKMGYNVHSRYDLTREATLEWFREVSNYSILGSVSCLFVFILSHGEGPKMFCTYDNKVVSLDEVRSCFLNKSCPNLRGKPKIFFSHFCRGTDEETVSQYSVDAKREAYKDMLCLYSSTEGFQALRHERLGTPSVRALCLTLARYAHCTHFRDIIRKFQEQYESMECATSPEVQDFKFIKYFYLNPTGDSR